MQKVVKCYTACYKAQSIIVILMQYASFIVDCYKIASLVLDLILSQLTCLCYFNYSCLSNITSVVANLTSSFVNVFIFFFTVFARCLLKNVDL